MDASMKSVSSMSPYDRPDADIILRSSDKVEFRAHRIILSLASPVFSDMFSLPQTTDELQVVDLPEDSGTLRTLLDACYPVTDPEPNLLCDVLDAALKYDMAKVVSLLQKSLVPFVNLQPLKVSAIACRIKDEKLAIMAAGQLAGQYRAVIRTTYVGELDRIPAGCYYRLLQYCDRRPGWEKLTFCGHEIDAARTHSGSSTGIPERMSAGPFPSDLPDTDIIIITSDNVRIHAHKVILAQASPVLRRMIKAKEDCTGMPTATPEGQPKLALRVEETDGVFGLLLQLCYPISKYPALEDVEFLLPLVPAAIKYQLDGVIWYIRGRWSGFAASKPLEAYFVAELYGWEEQARMAANSVLTQPLRALESTYVDIMETASARSYIRLLRYHANCTQAITVVSSTTASEWFPLAVCEGICSDCCRRYSVNQKPSWWAEGLQAILNNLRERPSTKTLGISMVALSMTFVDRCPHSASTDFNKTYMLSATCDEFARKIEDIIAKVDFQIR